MALTHTTETLDDVFVDLDGIGDIDTFKDVRAFLRRLIRSGNLGSINGLGASKAELDRVADVSARAVSADNTLAVTQALHDGKTILLDQADGSACTLPAATGTGTRFRFIVSVTVTSNVHSIACAGTDEFAGVVLQTDTDTSDTLAAYPALAADNFDIISMNGTTTGGLIGDWFEVEDIATGVWALRGYVNANGTVATPLAAS